MGVRHDFTKKLVAIMMTASKSPRPINDNVPKKIMPINDMDEKLINEIRAARVVTSIRWPTHDNSAGSSVSDAKTITPTVVDAAIASP